jgi:hypothetical protein
LRLIASASRASAIRCGGHDDLVPAFRDVPRIHFVKISFNPAMTSTAANSSENARTRARRLNQVDGRRDAPRTQN